MGWMQCATPFPGDFRIQEAFDLLWGLGGSSVDEALFCRTDREAGCEIFLLSPAAGRMINAMRSFGSWEPADDVQLHDWTFLVGRDDPARRLGVTLGHGDVRQVGVGTRLMDQLRIAAARASGDRSQRFNSELAERCCDLDLLEACHVPGVPTSDPGSLTYELTSRGRQVLAGL